jgi:nitrogen regulatory protein P-II 1
MELLVIVINREDYFERLISILVEAGVSGATIFNSEGLGHILTYEVPIFAGLKKFIGETKSVNRTIMAVLDNKEIFPRFKELLAEESLDFTKAGVGIIATLPISNFIGSKV